MVVSLTATMVFSIAGYEMNVAIVLGGGGLSQACVRSANMLNFWEIVIKPSLLV